MAKFLAVIGWPVICGVLFAVLLLQLYPEKFGVEPKNQQPTQVNSFANAVNIAAPSVVNIYTTKTVTGQKHPLADDPRFQQYFERRRQSQPQRPQTSLGSGVIFDERGYLLTNYHVIAGADEILISLYDGRETLAKIVGRDKETDLAVLKIDLNNVQPISFAPAGAARVGDIVLAIGNPFGFGQTVTQGIISATGRYGLNISTYENYLQTDADINPGNSGGALVDANGKLLGINSAIFSRNGGSQGIGLAIPVDIAQYVMNDLIDYGKVTRGWLGVEVKQLLAAVANEMGLSSSQGLMITGIYPTGPADSAGLEPGDIITSINGSSAGNGRNNSLEVARMMPGQEITVNVLRNKEQISIPVLVGSRPQ
jgi:serine protease DegS